MTTSLRHRRPEAWQVGLSTGVLAYLALGLATGTVRPFHWWMLLVIPAAFLFSEGCRRFFLDWAPLVVFWLVYDRLRLLQPLLLDRVAVRWPYELELGLFGGLCGGELPAHAARAALAAASARPLGKTILWAAQMVYLSHVPVVPLLLMWLWVRGRTPGPERDRFLRLVRAFSYLNFAALAIYVLVPVAPPWWISLHGLTQPNATLVAQAKLSDAMDGRLVAGLIQNAAQWFAALPSLHAAYPVLLVWPALKIRRRSFWIGTTVYALAMWAATVVLNQHYIIDLIAGGLLATLAWFASGLAKQRASGSQANAAT